MSKLGCFLYKIYRVPYFIRGKYSGMIFSHAVSECGRGIEMMPEFWIESGECIYIGNNFSARRGLRLEAWPKYKNYNYSPEIRIGNGVRVGEHCHIGAIDKVIIGNDVLMGSKVYITDHHHGDTSFEDMSKPPVERRLFSKGRVIIEDEVFIGDNVVIMPGVEIGHNSVIGSNSVVTKSIPPFSVAYGVPAKVRC